MCTAASFLCTCQRDGAHVCYYSVARQLLYGCWLGKCALVFICFPLLLSCTAKAIATPAATIANFRRTRQWNTCFSMHPVCVCVCVDIPRYLLPTWSPLFVRSTVSVLVIFIFGVVVSEAVQLAAFPPYLPKGRKLKSFKYLFGKLLCPLVMSILAIVWGKNFLLQSLFIFISRWGVVLQIILCINMIRTSPFEC